jgi:hypothetical protein
MRRKKKANRIVKSIMQKLYKKSIIYQVVCLSKEGQNKIVGKYVKMGILIRFKFSFLKIVLENSILFSRRIIIFLMCITNFFVTMMNHNESHDLRIFEYEEMRKTMAFACLDV